VLRVLQRAPSVVNVVHLPAAVLDPKGDLVLCDIAREDTSVVIGELRALGIEHGGSTSLEEVEIQLSDAAREAIRTAPSLTTAK